MPPGRFRNHLLPFIQASRPNSEFDSELSMILHKQQQRNRRSRTMQPPNSVTPSQLLRHSLAPISSQRHVQATSENPVPHAIETTTGFENHPASTN